MSCDYGVWFSSKRLSSDEAGRLYEALSEGSPDMVEAHPSVTAFYDELVMLHPEIDTIPEDRIDDHDYCPWSCAIDRSPGHVIVACVWPKADYVGALISSLARRHGLIMYDPQSHRVFYPDEAPHPSKPWWKLW